MCVSEKVFYETPPATFLLWPCVGHTLGKCQSLALFPSHPAWRTRPWFAASTVGKCPMVLLGCSSLHSGPYFVGPIFINERNHCNCCSYRFASHASLLRLKPIINRIPDHRSTRGAPLKGWKQELQRNHGAFIPVFYPYNYRGARLPNQPLFSFPPSSSDLLTNSYASTYL